MGRDFGPEVPFGAFRPNLTQRSLIPAGRYARKMARPLRSLLRRVSDAPIDVTVLGQQRMRLHPHGNSCEKRASSFSRISTTVMSYGCSLAFCTRVASSSILAPMSESTLIYAARTMLKPTAGRREHDRLTLESQAARVQS